MATKEEQLSEQLAVTQKLTAATEAMAKSLSRVESSYDTQIATVEKLTKAIEALAGKDLSKLNAVKLDQAKKEFQETEKQVTSLSGRIKDIGQTLTKKFPIAMGVAVSALSGFNQGLRNIAALGKSTIGVVGKIVDSIYQVGASIISIPFKMFNELVDTAAAAGGGMNELAQAIENLRKEFGDLKGPSSKAVLDTTKNLGDFTATGLSAWRVFGTVAERLEAMTKLAAALGNTFEVTKDQVASMGLALPAFQKGLGLTDEAMKSLSERSIAMGDSLSTTFIAITKQSTGLGKAFNLSQKTIARDMGKASQDVKHFGQSTVKEIGIAVVYAKKLGIELDKITGTLDAFETFDSAAENASKLSQSFGLTVDAFKLMDAQNPAEQLDMLRKSMKAAGQSTETMTRQQLKLLAQTTGLDEATAKLAFSSKNEGVSLDQIRKKSGEAEKKTLTQAEAMGKLSDSIERLVKAGTTQQGGFWQMFFKGFLGGIQASKEFRDIIWNIKRSLQETYIQGVRLGKAFVQIFPGVKQFLGGIADFFNPAKFKKLTSGVTNVITDWMKGLSDPNGKASFSGLMDNLKKKFFDFFDTSSPSGQKTLTGFKTMMKTMAKILSEGIKWISDKMSEGIKFLVDVLTGKVSLSAIGAKGAGGIGFLAQILEPIGDALGHAWTVLKDPMFLLIKTLFKKTRDFLMSDEVTSLIKPAIKPIAFALFGPMFARAVMGILTQTVSGIALKGISSMLAKKGATEVAKKAGASGLSKLAGTAGPVAAIIAGAAAIGKGVNTYTDKITSSMDHSSKVIAAGATGVIDALTLGLLPDDLKMTMANTFAEISDTITLAATEVFGTGFVVSFKKKLSTTFELFGSIYDFISKLFTGNQEEFSSSAAELGLSLVRFVVSAIEFTFVQLPILAGKLVVKVLDLIVGATLKIITAQMGLITKAADSVFGTHLSDTLNKFSDQVRKGVSETTKTTETYMQYASDGISKASETLQDKYLRTAEDQAKIAGQTTKSIKDSQDAMLKEANRSNTSQSPAANFSQESQSKYMKAAEEQANVAKAAAEKIGESQVIMATEVNKKIQASLDSVSNVDTSKMSERIDHYAKSLAKINDTIQNSAVGQALAAVGDMVKRTQELDSALAAAPNINVDARLKKLANATGIGGKFAYTVKSKEVVINLNLNVSLDVGEVEKVMIMRKTSIIRDRLEFATGPGTHGDEATPSIPDRYTPGWNVAPTKG